MANVIMSQYEEDTSGKARPTFALLINSIGEDYQTQLTAGVMDAARELDVNLICYISWVAGDYDALQFDKLYGFVKTLSEPDLCDGLILSNTFSNFTKRAAFSDLMMRYRDVPTVTITEIDPRLPNIAVDNDQAIRLMMSHLIEEHHYRRIGFIRGPLYQQEAEERYHAYCQMLVEHDIPLDPEIVLPGDFNRWAGVEAIENLLRRNIKLPEVIVACNDPMAIGAVEALQAHGLRVPEDIAVTGFDDTPDAITISSALTTIHQPVYEQGKLAVAELFARLQGRPPSPDAKLPAHLVTRASCGCHSYISSPSSSIATASLAQAPDMSEEELREHLPQIITQVAAVAAQSGLFLQPEAREKLVESFVDGVQGAESMPFLSLLRQQAEHFALNHQQHSVCQACLNTLFREVYARLSTPESRHRAEMLYFDGKQLLMEAQVRYLAARESRLKQHYTISYAIERSLHSTESFEELAEVIARELPRLHVQACYVCILEQDETNAESGVRVLGYNRQTVIDPQLFALCSDEQRMLPPALAAAHDRYSFLVAPIYVQNHLVGYTVIEMEMQQNSVVHDLV